MDGRGHARRSLYADVQSNAGIPARARLDRRPCSGSRGATHSTMRCAEFRDDPSEARWSAVPDYGAVGWAKEVEGLPDDDQLDVLDVIVSGRTRHCAQPRSALRLAMRPPWHAPDGL